MSSIFHIFDVANSGLNAEREAMNYASANIANQLTPGYKAQKPVFAAKAEDTSFSNMLAMMGSDESGVVSELINAEHKGMGVQVAQVSVDQKQGALVYMPNHPNADEDGNVEMSNVDSAEEMINMMEAVRQYKANLSIVEMAKKAAQEAMNMTKNG